MCRDPRTGSMPPRPRVTSTTRHLALQLRARIFDHLVHDLAYRDAAAGLSPADNCDFPAELPDFGFEVDSAHMARGNFFWLRHALSLTDKLATWQLRLSLLVGKLSSCQSDHGLCSISPA